MSDEEIARRMNRSRRFWDLHGSWLILAMVGICCWMAGSSFNAWTTASTVDVLVKSHERQDEKRVARIRELLEDNKRLTEKLGPQVAQAAKTAERAAKTAEQAVEKAAAPNQ
jgi:hypothetical protein